MSVVRTSTKSLIIVVGVWVGGARGVQGADAVVGFDDGGDGPRVQRAGRLVDAVCSK